MSVESPATSDRTRVVIVSTPRSGNTWLRHLLSVVYEIPTIAVHNPRDLDWDTLPRDCILQMHWHPIPSFLTRLEQGRFRVIVLARHPLDTLISILHFSLHEPTARWLEGEEGNERSIFGAMPRSSAFLQYAAGPRARALLSVTAEWWNLPGALQVHYESMVRDPQAELARVVEALGGEIKKPLGTALAATTIPRLRAMTQNDHHFWQGKIGLWRSLLTAHEAIEITRTHSAVTETLGYACDPDPDLNAVQADSNWIKLIWADLAADLQMLRELKRDRDQFKTGLGARDEELAKLKCEAEQLRQHSQHARLEMEQVRLASQTESERVQCHVNHLNALVSATQAELERVRAEYIYLQRGMHELVAQRNFAETSMQATRASVEGQLEEARRMFTESRDRHATLEEELRQAQERLREFADLNPRGIAVARRLGRMSHNHPILAKTAKKIFRLAG
jgi:hypothetical protein